MTHGFPAPPPRSAAVHCCCNSCCVSAQTRATDPAGVVLGLHLMSRVRAPTPPPVSMMSLFLNRCCGAISCFQVVTSQTDRWTHSNVPVSRCPLLCSRVWNTLTDNYGNVMAVDWKTSHTRSLHLPVLNLADREVACGCALAEPHEPLGRRCFTQPPPASTETGESVSGPV